MGSPASPPQRPDGNSIPPRTSISERLRAARIEAGKTARQLAAEVGCSPSLISQIERGKAAPSVSTLFAMATALSVSMDSLFPEADASRRAPAITEHEQFGGIVLRRADRPAIELEHDVRWERLTPRPERDVEFREVFYEAGGGSSGAERAIQHNGRDYAVVIDGELTAQIGFETFVLRAGDSLAFDATIPHRFWNEGKERVRAIFVLLDRKFP
ncbi:MAG TPA: helix-turn-helix domain-containing protein [Streptosporangiaceae bacterium]|nr:helix-turn-helix domain-containing protein [Streptosporangiaceae bacterium]